MSEVAQERETQRLEGVVSTVIIKGNDKWQIAVETPGSQYAKNIWTSDQEQMLALAQRIGQNIVFDCNVSSWTRQDGTPVKSLWLTGWHVPSEIEDGGMAPLGDAVAQAQAALAAAQAAQEAAKQAQAAAQPVPAVPAVVSYDDKETRIMREAADKASALVLASMISIGVLEKDDLTAERLHGFMDSFSNRRVRYYETGASFDTGEGIPF
jgi:hypothetical protein